MLIAKPVKQEVEKRYSEYQKAALKYLPVHQVDKFSDFPHLIEQELMNEAREPEIENTIKDLFDALHERNTVKLLKVLQGDKKKIFYAYKKQLMNAQRLSKQQAKVLNIISDKELSLLTISQIR